MWIVYCFLFADNNVRLLLGGTNQLLQIYIYGKPGMNPGLDRSRYKIEQIWRLQSTCFRLMANYSIIRTLWNLIILYEFFFLLILWHAIQYVDDVLTGKKSHLTTTIDRRCVYHVNCSHNFRMHLWHEMHATFTNASINVMCANF